MTEHRFPEGFIWGVATSAQQIEGGRNEDGRGDSVWDWHATQPGAIEDGSNPFTACDHYHRWREDVELMSWLGVGAYRLSTGWSRIMPEGRGAPNPQGLDFYDELVDGLLAAGSPPPPASPGRCWSRPDCVAQGRRGHVCPGRLQITGL